MIKNFILSGLKELWIDEINDKYILDPFIYYELEKTKKIKSFDSVETADYRRRTKADLIYDSNFINKKWNKYLPIIGNRLNTIHKKSFDIMFWEKALSISFERYITFVYEVYASCEKNFNPDFHKVNILSFKRIRPSIDFDKQRDLFQHSHFGKEQIFSLYIKFHNYIFHNELDISPKINRQNSRNPFVKKLKNINYHLIKREILKKLYKSQPHTIGIHGSFFSNENLNNLIIKSNGHVYPFDWNINYETNFNIIWANERELLSEINSDFDKFDKFFFYTFRYLFPMDFIENFSNILNYYKNLFDKNSKLKYMTSEAWPSCSTLSIGLAYLKTMGVKHIYNEHNYFAHPYVNNELNKAIKMVDIFTSLGWYDKKHSNMIKSSSMFNFKIKKEKFPVYEICYLTDVKQINMAQITPSYGTSCENALKYYEFVKLFFSGLTNKTLKKIYFREYPKNITDNWLHYDDNYMLQPYIEKMKKIDSVKETGKQSIAKSKLVIVDYLSTPYLESIISDIPTIFFHNQETYYLKNEFSDFFDPLLECGICQNNPIKAAKFLNQIKHDPQEWWESKLVQKNKSIFIKNNISTNGQLQKYLLKISVK